MFAFLVVARLRWTATWKGSEVHVTSGPVPLGSDLPHSKLPLVGLRFSSDFVHSIAGEATLLRPSFLRRALRKYAPSILSIEIDPSVLQASFRIKAEAASNAVELLATAGFTQPIDLVAEDQFLALYVEARCEEVEGRPCSLCPA